MNTCIYISYFYRRNLNNRDDMTRHAIYAGSPQAASLLAGGNAFVVISAE